MRIESVEIKNFRQYQDVKFRFPKTGAKDLHIILGSNGVGKTNFLNAITWCLYNVELHLGDRNTATEKINNNIVNNLRSKGIRAGEVSVSVELSAEDGNTKIFFIRKCKYTINTDNVFQQPDEFIVKVFEGGEWQIYDDEENTLFIVNKYVPQSINEYIFFDGEHLEHYFQEGQRDNIRNGINKLTQADIVEKAASAFKKYVDTELSPILLNSSDAVLRTKQLEVDELTQQVKDQKAIIAAIDDDITLCDTKISEASILIHGNDSLPEKMHEYESLEQALEQLEIKKLNKQKDINIFARKYYQYFAIYPAIKGYYDYIKKQEKEGKLPPRIDKNLIADILSSHKCCICDTELSDHAYHFVEEMQKSLDISSNVSAELNRSMTAMENFISFIKEYKCSRDKLFDQLGDIDSDLNSKKERYEQLAKYIREIPNQAEITRAFSDRETYKSLKEAKLIEKGGEKAILDNLEKKLIEANKELEKALDKNKDVEEVKTKKRFCESSSIILSQIHDEILTECRQEMQTKTFDIFSNLIWKKDTFKSVSISDSYEFKLMDSYGNQTLGSCSAAERALLALSFTLALQHSSKHDAMLFIDTPIGRVDANNRNNFIQTLLAISQEKQVILTFTPTEYDERVRQLLAGNYSTSNKLLMNEDITSIK